MKHLTSIALLFMVVSLQALPAGGSKGWTHRAYPEHFTLTLTLTGTGDPATDGLYFESLYGDEWIRITPAGAGERGWDLLGDGILYAIDPDRLIYTQLLYPSRERIWIIYATLHEGDWPADPFPPGTGSLNTVIAYSIETTAEAPTPLHVTEWEIDAVYWPYLLNAPLLGIHSIGRKDRDEQDN